MATFKTSMDDYCSTLTHTPENPSTEQRLVGEEIHRTMNFCDIDSEEWKVVYGRAGGGGYVLVGEYKFPSVSTAITFRSEALLSARKHDVHMKASLKRIPTGKKLVKVEVFIGDGDGCSQLDFEIASSLEYLFQQFRGFQCTVGYIVNPHN